MNATKHYLTVAAAPGTTLCCVEVLDETGKTIGRLGGAMLYSHAEMLRKELEVYAGLIGALLITNQVPPTRDGKEGETK